MLFTKRNGYYSECNGLCQRTEKGASRQHYVRTSTETHLHVEPDGPSAPHSLNEGPVNANVRLWNKMWDKISHYEWETRALIYRYWTGISFPTIPNAVTLLVLKYVQVQHRCMLFANSFTPQLAELMDIEPGDDEGLCVQTLTHKGQNKKPDIILTS